MNIETPTYPPSATTSTSVFITIAGTATDEHGSRSVTWANDRGGSGAATGTTNWTAANIPLQAGTNVITVSAYDANGIRSTDTLTVTSPRSLLAGGRRDRRFFDLDVLVANPTTTPAPVDVTFHREDGVRGHADHVRCAPTSRTTHPRGRHRRAREPGRRVDAS